jgi:hypothetical protein
MPRTGTRSNLKDEPLRGHQLAGTHCWPLLSVSSSSDQGWPFMCAPATTGRWVWVDNKRFVGAVCQAGTWNECANLVPTVTTLKPRHRHRSRVRCGAERVRERPISSVTTLRGYCAWGTGGPRGDDERSARPGTESTPCSEFEAGFQPSPAQVP